MQNSTSCAGHAACCSSSRTDVLGWHEPFLHRDDLASEKEPLERLEGWLLPCVLILDDLVRPREVRLQRRVKNFEFGTRSRMIREDCQDETCTEKTRRRWLPRTMD
ncbi:uncharacterized protein MYCGRDRAFT_104669 [Zymoseptoria tritici IPO323]|uniref:Uncharacterized protein n=1 Tax=Zymoseptoria tritici (strain CBS 115943 / IPO323) TaxID=336722 RepID=F9XB34_ZYMTI|nr:uncharacterized protein MYCGRDRAFT_104669 [Zymoseptoria tritici IPO323]EGP87413.1 hypothetical protein MYCGRDRAFT_104669 [Zymoseptoria tritici IPO323]